MKPTYDIILWGFGNMNKIILRMAQEKGHNVVGVIGHHNIGEDAGCVAGLKEAGIEISSEEDAVQVIKRNKPHACILATKSTIKEIIPCLKILGQHGVNTITIAEEATFSWNTSPELTKEVDEIFKANNCTFTGTGMEDIFWCYLPVSIVGATHKVEKIEGFVQYNVDDYGTALCEAHGVGLSKQEFQEKIVKDALPAYVWNSNDWICSKLGWSIQKTTQQLLPTVGNLDVLSKTFGKLISKGLATGMTAVVTTVCENGVIIETKMTGQVYYGDMYDVCSWKIIGERTTEVVVKKPDTVGICCACAVNRLKHVVQGQPGYITSDKLGLIC